MIYRLIIVSLSMVTVTLIIYCTYHTNNNPIPAIKINIGEYPKRKPSPKLILFYTSYFSQQLPGSQKQCACSNPICKPTTDVKDFNKSDMVMFHGRNMPAISHLGKLHDKRPPHQLWAYFIMENAYHAPPVQPLDILFDVAISYRLNSYVRYPYRYSEPISEVKKPVTQVNYAVGKTKQILWGISNCGGLRLQLAQKLIEYGFSIDNFGRCQIPHINNVAFDINESKKYKFYFAAENRLCKEYISEKYWTTSINMNAIPIVLGGSNYSNPLLAIPGSFIDALRFNSPKKLAEYLKLVEKNDTLFNEYFKWKPFWKFPDDCKIIMCDICNKLQSNSFKKKDKPLSSTIDSSYECVEAENYFRNWINK